MSFIIDTYGMPSKAAVSMPGCLGASRYISHDAGKCVTRSQVLTLLSWNKVVDLNFEDSATRAQQGGQAGVEDADFSVTLMAQTLKTPLGVACYYSADFPYEPATWAEELSYYAEAAVVTRKNGYVMGAYGDYTTITKLLAAKVIDLGWQTTAWSNNLRNPQGVLYQNTYTAGYDIDVVEANYWGAWTKNGAQVKPVIVVPKPPPAPVAPPKEDDDVVLLGYGYAAKQPHLINEGQGWNAIMATLTEESAVKAGAIKLQFGKGDFEKRCKEAGVAA